MGGMPVGGMPGMENARYGRHGSLSIDAKEWAVALEVKTSISVLSPVNWSRQAGAAGWQVSLDDETEEEGESRPLDLKEA